MADTLVGSAADDIHFVDSVDDVIQDPGGNDTIQTNLGSYTLPFAGGSNEIENLEFIGVGSFVGAGNNLANRISGGSGNDTLQGGMGADTLVGGDGNDRLVGGEFFQFPGPPPTVSFSDMTPGDRLEGGTGNDTYVVGVGDVVVELPGGGTDTVEFSRLADGNPSETYTLVLWENVENLTVYDSFNVWAVGNGLDNVISVGSRYNPGMIFATTTLDGGAGADTLIGSNGSDTYVVDSVGDVIVETNSGFSQDTVITTLNQYTLGANLEILTYSGTGAFEGTGNGLDNTISGGDGNDTLDGGGDGFDTLIGGKGDDLYRVDAGSSFESRITEALNGGVDTVEYRGQAINGNVSMADNVEKAVFVGAGDIEIAGNNLDNSITTRDGNDTLDGGAGIDTLTGGTGDDWYVIDSAADVIVELSGEGRDTVQSHLLNYTLGANLENLRLGDRESITNSNGNGNELNNDLRGNDGVNVLDGAGGDDTIHGAGGDDTIDGGDGHDTIYTSGDRASVKGSAGNDTIFAGGDLILDSGGASLEGGSGNDTIYSGFGNDLIDGGTGDDALVGFDGNDTITGGDGSDTIEGGAGDDFINGGDGFDYVNFAGAMADYILTKNQDGSVTIKDSWSFDGDDGTDTIRGIEGFHFKEGTISLTTLMSLEDGPITVPDTPTGPPPPTVKNISGSSASETIYGDALNDSLKGNKGNDKLYGLGGDDRLWGGAGKDVLYGGAGKDIFIFDTKLNAKANVDKIVDFKVADDTIWLDNAIFRKLGKGSEAKPVKLNKKFFTVGDKAKDGNDYVIYNKYKGVLYYDADGSGSGKAVEIATLTKKLKMTYADFFVV